MKKFRSAFSFGVACFLAVAAATPTSAKPAGSATDWSRYADVKTIVAVTADEDGAVRETTIWLVVVEGCGYIRTGNTTWGDNIVRNAAVAIRVDGEELPVQIQFVEDEALRERIIAAFREKYGWLDAVISIFRGSHPKIMQLDPRP